jgi:hypothetical protein
MSVVEIVHRGVNIVKQHAAIAHIHLALSAIFVVVVVA